MGSQIITKRFIKKVYKGVEFFAQYIVLGGVYYIAASIVNALANAQNSFWKGGLTWVILLLLYEFA